MKVEITFAVSGQVLWEGGFLCTRFAKLSAPEEPVRERGKSDREEEESALEYDVSKG